MRAVIQRVTRSSVSVEGSQIASIQKGLLILLGIGPRDTEETASKLAAKIAALRIFEDVAGKMNLSLGEVGGKAIVVSQFTLYADTRRGNRPSFIDAAAPEHARTLCDRFIKLLTIQGVDVQSGKFGAHMQVELVNDGPVTILMLEET